jgi:DNA-binding helix-hairpin-helix protein with protein kinase domain
MGAARAMVTAADVCELKGQRDGIVYRFADVVGAGGEGQVRTVDGHRGLVAKTYLHPLTREKQEKIQDLVRGAQANLLQVAAWPTEALVDRQGRVAGFLMPRVDGALSLYELFSPRSRIRSFPAADFRFLVHVAANIARLFATIHAGGYIVGDVNQNNILVRMDGTVAAIDVDSFQIGDGSRYRCGVATELYLAPELKGVDLMGVSRVCEHDAFGLAVLLFQLLFMGRHPHAGRFLGRGDMPIEQAIAESRFAYSRHANRTRMAPPPHTPPIDAVGPAADLFERAFAPPNAKRPRPTADEWLATLLELRATLVPCRSVAWHHHHNRLDTCPWCAIETASKVKLFGGVVTRPRKAIADVATLWKRVETAVLPRPIPMPPSEQSWRRTEHSTSWSTILRHPLAALIAVAAPAAIAAAASAPVERWLILLGTSAVMIIVAAMPWSRQHKGTVSLAEALAAEHDYDTAVADLRALRPNAVYEAQKQKLLALKSAIDDLGSLSPNSTAADAQTEAEQREQFLTRHVIEQAKLFNIGPARCAVLRSWGIETAADIDEAKLDDIPGFGRNLRDRLVAWKEGLERSFVFVPPTLTQQPRDREDFDRELSARRIKLMTELRSEIDAYLGLLADMETERGRAAEALSKAFERKVRGEAVLLRYRSRTRR